MDYTHCDIFPVYELTVISTYTRDNFCVVCFSHLLIWTVIYVSEIKRFFFVFNDANGQTLLFSFVWSENNLADEVEFSELYKQEIGRY